MARRWLGSGAVLLGLLWLGCTDKPVVEPPPVPLPPPPPPPAAVRVAFQGALGDGISDAALAPFKVALHDAHGNLVARDSVNITVRLAANPDSATLHGTLTVPTRAGIAEFTDVWIDRAAAGYRLIASAANLASDTSTSFTMTAPIPFDRSVIAASAQSTCALDESGAAWCWGDNVVGQLGEGRRLWSTTPVPVVGNLRFSKISVYPGISDGIDDRDGEKIACGLTTGGEIYCWGGGGTAFGDGVTPSRVPGSRTFSSVGIGYGVCGLASDGTVWCWGLGADKSPKQIETDVRFVTLGDAGGNCGLTAAGKAYCWGRGPLGNGQWNYNDTVVAVSGDHVFRQIATGEGHHCGIDDDGAAWCWGGAEHPFLGDSSGEVEALVPVRTPGTRGLRSISAGGSHTCALDGDGRLWCWAATVSLISGVPKFAMISAGTRSGYCALTPDGEAWCGAARVPGTERYSWISTGDWATCAVTTGGEGRCWGYNHAGMLADGHPLRSPVPIRVAGGKAFESLSGGGDAMCGMTASDETWCWGTADSAGQRSTPARLLGDPRLKVVSLADEEGCGIDARGQGWCWGRGLMVGNGDPYAYAPRPVPILGNIRLSAINVGMDVCALTSGGDVYCWGPVFHTPTLIPGGRKFVALAGGLESHCALTAAGDAYCWSYIEHQPLLLPGGLHLAVISADGGLACGLTTEGKGYCWHPSPGRYPPLGWLAPEPVPGDLTFNKIVISHGSGGHVCGTTPDGTIYCWGANDRGQVGNGQVDTSMVTVPTPVVGGLKARHSTSLP